MAEKDFNTLLKEAESSLNKYNEGLYDVVKDMISGLNDFIHILSDLNKILNKYPTDISAQNIGLLYKTLLWKYSYNYTTTRERLLNKIDKFRIKYKSSTSIMNTFYESISVIPSKLTDALNYTDSIISIINELSSKVTIYKVNLVESLNNIAGKPKLWDRRIANLQSRMYSTMQAPSTDGYVDRLKTIKSEQKRIDESLASAKKTDLEFKQYIANLETSTQLGTAFSKKFSQLTLKNVLLRREIDTRAIGGKERLEQYWRSKVRKKYDNDVPFCDEVDAEGNIVKIKTADGTEVFAKASEVIKVNGEYKKIQGIRDDLIKGEFNNPNNAIY